MIDIRSSNTLMAYSSEELQEHARKGLLCCGGHDLTEFLEKLLSVEDKEEDQYCENCDSLESQVDDVREEVRRAIEILEAI
jgi:uncharacterized protein Yka (UPF0111/DUF47 family)